MTGYQTLDPRLDILVRTREILSDPAHWTKFAFWTSDGEYCLLGALARAANVSFMEALDVDWLSWSLHPAYGDAVLMIKKQIGGFGIAAWNDDLRTQHADVLRVLDAAIAQVHEQAGGGK